MTTEFQWLSNGEEAFPAMLEAIARARTSVYLETYAFKESRLGEQFREALVLARRRGVDVKVVVDFIGSRSLRTSFWDPLIQAGGAFRWFNPWNPWFLGIRNHRKILVCDEAVAFVGGFNISPEYEGDGVNRGWRDLGLEIRGSLARALAESFMDSFERADFKHKRLQRLRRSPFNQLISGEGWTLLLSGPGRGRRHLKSSLVRDLSRASIIRIAAAYFLPTWKLRRTLLRAARRGAHVEIILPEKSDVILSVLASRCLYTDLLRAGVRIYEYRPQILHTKLILTDRAVYTGSANLDARSLNINYELLVRVEDKEVMRRADQILAEDLKHCRRVTRAGWKQVRPFWRRWLERWAYLLLARLDPYLARLYAREVP